MGAGNKMDPTRFEVADIFQTSVCPLSRAVRRELKKRGVEHLKVVYSREEPVVPREEPASTHEDADSRTSAAVGKRRPTASISFVPSVAGLIMAAEVVRDLIES
jgi:tRNA A37 threonylcarbamoyladenosine dehydratase